MISKYGVASLRGSAPKWRCGTLKLLIVDDHPVVRAGLRRLLAAEDRVEIAEAASGQEAIGVSYKTVANQCTRLKAKLATTRMADLIRVAISSGLGRGEPQFPARLPPSGAR